VAEAIESILNQTYSNLEFVIVDDCSTDNTFQICKQYAEKDARIRLFRNEVNSKIEFSLNRALQESHGKYIVRMDGDDISDLQRLEKMKEFLDSNPDIKLVGTSAITINANGEEIGRTVFLNDYDLIKRTCLLKTPVVHIWMTYKEIYDELKGYRKLFATEDYDFVLRLMSMGYKCSNMSEYFGYKIRVNRKGNSSSTYGVKKMKSHWYTAKLFKERLKNGNDSYSLENCSKSIKTSVRTEKIYSFSNLFLYKAIECKAQKKFLGMILFLALSFVSIYQIAYLFETLKYKRIVKGV
ncbi:MAG: glycosyltransferase family 2 protein, partial [Treponema sp.]|nr:glycosyltransferase family 2 protein [Treponema sp.]